MTVPPRGGVRRRDDRGVVLILVSLLMIAILTMAAIVLDLGLARASRRADQTATDLASLAAGFFLSGRGSASVLPNPQLACKAAITSVETNVSDFVPVMSDGAKTAACAVFPDNSLTGCNSGTAAVDVTVTHAPYTLVIRYPVPDSEISESRFVGGTGADDGTNRCERMRVTVTHSNPTNFAKIVGVDTVTTNGTTVVRANSSQIGQGVAALLLLERVGCGSLQTSGGGSGGSGVTVEASSATNPGVIQSDSAGVVGTAAPISCTTNENESGYSIYGGALPSAGGGGPSITASASTNGASGIIGLYSLNVGGRGAAVFPGGLSVSPVGSSITSRQSTDDKYNKSAATGGHAQITNLHSTAYAATTMTTTAATTAGYTVITGGDCNAASTGNPYPTATKIFVNCSSFGPDQLIFPLATDIVFTGKVDIGNNRVLSLPAARRVYVRGCTSSCSGGNDFAINVAGTLLINTGESAIPSPATGGTTCASRRGPGATPPGTTTGWTALATFSGPLKVTGQARLCQTFAYLGPNSSTYSRQAVTVTGGNYPTVTQCSPVLPCPKADSTNHASITFGGGSGTADWSAPNQVSAQPTQADLATNPFEDIALWTEASLASDIKGQGANTTEGVYFLPNAPVTFTGQATQLQPLNAQFLVRSLNVSSQGSLFLKPNLADAVLTPIPGNVEIIR